MSDDTILRAADAPDVTCDAPGAFIGYGRALGAGQIALNIRVLEPRTAHVARRRPDPRPQPGFWPEH